MRSDKIIQWLKMLGCKVPATQNRSGWIISNCPLGPFSHQGGKSNDHAFAVRAEQGDAFCTCFSCDFHGAQSELLIRLGYLNSKNPQRQYPIAEAMTMIIEADDFELEFGTDIEDMLNAQQSGDHVFPEEWLATFPLASDVELATEYMADRGFGKQIISALDVRWDVTQRRVCFPVRDFNGTLMGLHGRGIYPSIDPRYRMYSHQDRNNPHIWLGEHEIDFNKPIVVVEGPMDYAAVYRVYRNVATPLFASVNEQKLLRMSDAFEWVTLFDTGKAGDKARDKVTRSLPTNLIKHLDTGSYKDPGAMPAADLIELLQDHVSISKLILA